MKPNDLDAIQNYIISVHQHKGSCWNCLYLSKSVKSDFFLTCKHPFNNKLNGRSVDGLILDYIKSHGLYDENVSDFNIGKHCNLYKYLPVETELDDAKIDDAEINVF
jgi:hypothetical protein